MNKLTKIALGLCAVKVGLETTKYISGKWGNGKMKKNIENAQIAIANAIEEVGKEVAKQVGAVGTEMAKQFGERTKTKEETKRQAIKQEQENNRQSRESEKQIIETIEELRKDNENEKNDEGIEFYEKLLLEERKARTEAETEERKARLKAEDDERKERVMEKWMIAGLCGAAIAGVVVITSEAIRNSF